MARYKSRLLTYLLTYLLERDDRNVSRVCAHSQAKYEVDHGREISSFQRGLQ